MASSWDQFPEVGKSQPRGAGIILRDPYQERGDQRDETRTGIAVDSNDRDSARFEREGGKDARQGMADLRKEFSALPEVKAYKEAATALDTGLFTKDDGSGDGTLLYQYSKLMDPMGSVREGDVQLAQSGAGYLSAKAAELKKNFGVGGGGSLPPEIREGLRREMIGRFNSLNRAYNQRRQEFRSVAGQAQYDPEYVIGEHAGAPFLERFRDYDKRNGIGTASQPQQPGGGAIPGPTADNIAFDIDTGTGAFGSQIEAPRLNPQQQNALDAFLKANAGNPNFGPDQLSAFYQSMGIQGGAMAADDKFFEAVRNGEEFGTKPNYAAADEEAKRIAMEASLLEAPEGADVSQYGLDKGLLLNMTDELRGGVGGIRSLLSGDGFGSGYQRERDIERALQERSRGQNGIVPELAGSLLTPAGVVSRTNMARDAAAMGAMAGFGEGEGAVDSLSKSATGGALGYAAGKGLEAATPYIANSGIAQKAGAYFGQGRAQQIDDFAKAAERQDLDYLPADVPGSYKSKFATGLAGMTLGGVPLKVAAGKIVDKAQAAKDRIAGSVGNAGDNVATGQAAQGGMTAWKSASGDRGGKLYDAIPIPGDTTVDLTASKQALSDINGAISSNADLAALVRDPKLVAYQQALEKGDLSWNDIKSFRSYIGEKAGRPTLQQDTSKDNLDALYGALSQDIERAAAAHSPEAAKAFARANSYWRGRQSRINDVMTKIVGKDGNLSAEQTTAQLERWAQSKGGDFNKLARAVRSLPEDEASNVRSYFIDRMGMSPAGRQDGSGEVFSPDTWLTNWNSLSPRAKAVLFQGEHRKALDDLATVFSGMKASRLFANPSGTGYSVWGAANAAMATADLATFGMTSAGQIGAGALLGSPRIAKWLVALSKKPNQSAQLAHIGQLSAIARSEPVIANDIFTLQERLADAFAQPQSLRAAAEENDDVRNQKIREGERYDAQ